MKKFLYLFWASFIAMSLNACSTDNDDSIVEPPVEDTDTPDNPDSEGSEEQEPDTPDTPASGKTLIVYYSFTNNVHTIATDLQTQIDGADILRVEPAEEGLDYAANNYAIGSALIAAIRENPDDASSYPAIKTTIDNLADYNRVIVATPLWWSNMAAPMQTFLFTYGAQMEGKSIGLIVSSASSGISGVESDARRLIAGGNFLSPSLWIRSSQTSNCHSLISAWLDEIN